MVRGGGKGSQKKKKKKSQKVTQPLHKKGPTGNRPMAHPIVFRYLSYSTTLAEHAVHRLQRCLAFDQVGTCFFLSVSQSRSNRVATRPWPDERQGHGKNLM